MRAWVTLENKRLRAVLDPERAGGAVSLVDGISGKELAGCVSYRQRRIPALIEILAGQAIAEGRVDDLPPACALSSRMAGMPMARIASCFAPARASRAS